MKSGNGYVVEANAQMLKKIKAEPTFFSRENIANIDGKFADFAEDLDDLACPNCRFDVLLNNNRKYEFKSYKQTTVEKIPSSSGFLQQHTGYLSASNSWDEVNYVFEKGKLPDYISTPDGGTLTVQQFIRSRFHEMYKNNADEVYNARPELFDGYTLRNGEPVADSNIGAFMNEIDISHPMFSRIIAE